MKGGRKEREKRKDDPFLPFPAPFCAAIEKKR